MNKTIYLDMAATTPITKSILEAMFPYLTEIMAIHHHYTL